MCFLPLLISVHTLKGQNFFFDTYNVSEGLAQSTVFDILQDHNDFIWLGTRAGVSRFDGKEFLNFTIDDGLAENGVRIIFQDDENKIWFGHIGGGISVFDGKSFHIFSHPGDFFSSDITAILKDDEGNLWITSEASGVIKSDNITDSLSTSDLEHYMGGDISDRVFGATRLRDGRLVFIADPFPKSYDPVKNQFSNFFFEGMPTHFFITCIFEDSRDNLWFGTFNGGLYKYIPALDTVKVYDIRDGLSSNWISWITEDKDGVLWVGTWGGGITLIKDKRNRILDNSNGLPDLSIRNILQDREGNMLIGTEENGLSIFKGFEFVSLFSSDGLIGQQVSALVQDNSGTIWFGTSRGISLYDPELLTGQRIKEFSRLKGSSIIHMKEDNNSRIWIVTDNDNDSLFYYDEQKGKLYHARVRPFEFLNQVVINALETDEQSTIWMGTADGLVRFNGETLGYRVFSQLDGLSSNEITSLYHGNDGILWIGTLGGGLNYFDPYLYNNNEVGKLYLEESFIANCINADHDGYLWVGTQANGVYKIDPANRRIIQRLTVSNGLFSNIINLITTDKEGRVYIGTNKGLNIYDSYEDRIYNFNDKNGFPGIETKRNAVYIDDSAKVWFGTVQGVTRLDPDELRPSNLDPLTHITGFKVNLEDRQMREGLKLKHNENDVIFEYISICLTNPEAVAYQIMLEGVEEWRPVTTQTSVTYPSLAPGEYIFKVIGRNSDGYWNKEPITFSFEIRPPFYKTTWFILLSIFMGILGVIIYVKIRERNLIREKRILEEKVVERTAEVVAQKEQIAQKNKDITDSIRYAKRIQVATLPPEIPFDDTFVLYKPKDIVSGDFYWLEKAGGKEFMAAVDCTGHGVPGAFMSIIGTNLLNKIVKEQHIYKPSEILNILNEELIYSLKSTDEDGIVYDGMDLALVSYDKKTGEIEYAGGYNPLVIVRNGDIEEIKADRFSIGRSSLEHPDRKFTNHKEKIYKGDMIYIFSDGYSDQFGGETGKKFKARPMKELFIAISEKTMEEQKSILKNTIEVWMGNIEQVDDILVIGRRF
jgi:ligand-binding sensor domain-containing protein/serine phosphatase RsbU (regulator of sigma subunit)